MKNNNEWMSISDMMSGLMLIFMFIAISFMIEVQSDKEKIQEIAITYNKSKKDLNKDLHIEFENDLKRWDAQITKDNSIIFNSPDVLFERGQSIIRDSFGNILDDFFPRYIKVLSIDKHKNEIDEIRIAGHTTDIWNDFTSKKDTYLKNMTLSQNRANNVLSYCYNLNNNTINQHRNWLEKKLRANGMSFAKLKYKDKYKKSVDYEKSRRVEFKVEMKTEEKIYKILKAST